MLPSISKLAVVLSLLCLSCTAGAVTTSVTAIALFNDKAMLSVDGGKPKIVHVGSVHEGVKVISANTDEVTVEVNGVTEVLTLNSTTQLNQSLGSAPASSYAEEITLYVNDRGFFESDGQIDGKGIRFLVDTGANIVVLSSAQAQAIGLDYEDGVRTYASTASGIAPMYGITLREISLGGIKLNNIRAGVIEGRFPEMPLLGMTFLSRLSMTRDGNAMVLKRR